MYLYFNVSHWHLKFQHSVLFTYSLLFSLSLSLSVSDALPFLPKSLNQTPSSSLPLNSPPLLFSIQQLANFNGDPSSSFSKVRGGSGLRGGSSQTILDQVPQRIGARSLHAFRSLFGFWESQGRDFPPLHRSRCLLSPRFCSSVSPFSFFNFH